MLYLSEISFLFPAKGKERSVTSMYLASNLFETVWRFRAWSGSVGTHSLTCFFLCGRFVVSLAQSPLPVRWTRFMLLVVGGPLMRAEQMRPPLQAGFWPTRKYVRMRRECHNGPTVTANCNELVQEPRLT